MTPSLWIPSGAFADTREASTHHLTEVCVLDVDTAREVLGLDSIPIPKPSLRFTPAAPMEHDALPPHIASQLAGDAPLSLKAVAGMLRATRTTMHWPDDVPRLSVAHFQRSAEQIDESLAAKDQSSTRRAADFLLSGVPGFLPIAYPSAPTKEEVPPCLRLLLHFEGIDYGVKTIEPVWGQFSVYRRRLVSGDVVLVKLTETFYLDFTTGITGFDGIGIGTGSRGDGSRVCEVRIPLDRQYAIDDIVLVLILEQVAENNNNSRHASYARAWEHDQKARTKVGPIEKSLGPTTDTADDYEQIYARFPKQVQDAIRKEQNILATRALASWRRNGAMRLPVAVGFGALDLNELVTHPIPVETLESSTNPLVRHAHDVVQTRDKILISPYARYDLSNAWTFVTFSMGPEGMSITPQTFTQLLAEHYSSLLSKVLTPLPYIRARTRLVFLNTGYFQMKYKAVCIFTEHPTTTSLGPDMLVNQTATQLQTRRQLVEKNIRTGKPHRGLDGVEYPSALASMLAGAESQTLPLEPPDLLRLLLTRDPVSLARSFVDISVPITRVARNPKQLRNSYSLELDTFHEQFGCYSASNNHLFSNRLYLTVDRCLLARPSDFIIISVELRDSDSMASYSAIPAFYSRYSESYVPAAPRPQVLCDSVIQLGAGSFQPGMNGSNEGPILLSTQLSSCAAYNKGAYFGTEFKVELPLAITPLMHFFFTIYAFTPGGDKPDRTLLPGRPLGLDGAIEDTATSISRVNIAQHRGTDGVCTPIGYAFLPLQTKVNGELIPIGTNPITLCVHEQLTPEYLTHQTIPNRASSTLCVSCLAKSQIFVQQPELSLAFRELDRVYESLRDGPNASPRISFCASASDVGGAELASAELSPIIRCLIGRLETLRDALSVSNLGFAVHMPLLLWMTVLLLQRVSRMSNGPELMRTCVGVTRAVISACLMISHQPKASENRAFDVLVQALFDTCVYRTLFRYEPLLRHHTSISTALRTSDYIRSPPELDANALEEKARCSTYSELIESLSIGPFSIPFLLDGSTSFSGRVLSRFVHGSQPEICHIFSAALDRLPLYDSPRMLLAAIEHLTYGLYSGGDMHHAYFELILLKRSLFEVLSDELTVSNMRISFTGSSVHTVVHPDGQRKTLDTASICRALRSLFVELGQRLVEHCGKDDCMPQLGIISQQVAGIIAVFYSFGMNTFGAILVANFCQTVLPSTVDTWTYNMHQQCQTVGQSAATYGFSGTFQNVEALPEFKDAPEETQRHLGRLFRYVYYPFFTELFVTGLPYIHAAYQQIRRYAKAGRIEGEMIPQPPVGLTSIRATLFKNGAERSEGLSTCTIAGQDEAQTLSGFKATTPLNTNQSQRQILFTELEQLTIDQLVPPVIQYLQDMMIHCLWRCSTNDVPQLILFLRDLVLPLPFECTDVLRGSWERYHYPNSLFVRAVFYILISSLHRILKCTYSCTDRSVSSFKAETDGLVPNSPTASDTLLTHVMHCSSPNTTLTSLTHRTALHLLLFTVLYDREILSISSTTLEHLTTFAYCISVLPHFYTPEALSRTQLIVPSVSHGFDREAAHLVHLATNYSISALETVAESPHDRVSHLADELYRFLGAIYTPQLIISTTGEFSALKVRRKRASKQIKGFFGRLGRSLSRNSSDLNVFSRNRQHQSRKGRHAEEQDSGVEDLSQTGSFTASFRSSIRSSVRQLDDFDTSSVIFDGTSDAGSFFESFLDISGDVAVTRGFRDVNAKIVQYLGYTTVAYGLHQFKAVFQHFRILISLIKTSSAVSRISRGSILQPTLAFSSDPVSIASSTPLTATSPATPKLSTAPGPQSIRTSPASKIVQLPNNTLITTYITRLIETTTALCHAYATTPLLGAQHHLRLMDYIRDFISGYKEFFFSSSGLSLFGHFQIYDVLFLFRGAEDERLRTKADDLFLYIFREELYKTKTNTLSFVQITSYMSTTLVKGESLELIREVIRGIAGKSNSLKTFCSDLERVLQEKHRISEVAQCRDPATGLAACAFDLLISLHFSQAEVYYEQPELRFDTLKTLRNLLLGQGCNCEAGYLSVLMASLIAEFIYSAPTSLDTYSVEHRFVSVLGRTGGAPLTTQQIATPSRRSVASCTSTPTSHIGGLRQTIQQPRMTEGIWLFQEYIKSFRQLIPSLTLQTPRDVVQRYLAQTSPLFTFEDFKHTLHQAAEHFIEAQRLREACIVLSILAGIYTQHFNLEMLTQTITAQKRILDMETKAHQTQRAYLLTFSGFPPRMLGNTHNEYVYMSQLCLEEFIDSIRSFYTTKYPNIVISGQAGHGDSDSICRIRISQVVPARMTRDSSLAESLVPEFQQALTTYYNTLSGYSDDDPLDITLTDLDVPETTTSFSPIARFANQRMGDLGFNVSRFVTFATDLAFQQGYTFIYKCSYAERAEAPENRAQIDRYCFLPDSFPNCITRQPVIGSYSRTIPPIVANAFRIVERADTIVRSVREGAPLGQIQMHLSGILMAYVNRGLVPLVETFLNPVPGTTYVDPIESLGGIFTDAMSQAIKKLASTRRTEQWESDRATVQQRSHQNQSRRFADSHSLTDELRRISTNFDELTDFRRSKNVRLSRLSIYDPSSPRESATTPSTGDVTSDLCPLSDTLVWQDTCPEDYLRDCLIYLLDQTLVGLDYSTCLCHPGAHENSLQKTLLAEYRQLVAKICPYLPGWNYTPLIHLTNALEMFLDEL
ncbi:hypothetical protein GMRT_14231 [Giardia muris]|uniref:C2 DOCK-type domain-containing protein n=1 Tax=Giardia muris TaxID=5742 RepID=A0A4Z1SXH5_GIAMU|nr:hypothetical protein GMRT_14231 [Giardia muris]|eukprot:TNJ30230.1 hypothetical protein GMRT_14231 [Giardia muris]